ncbi:hypothetical protein DAPPPG734_18470 [Pantoea agglomerans]|uniref:Uncharacterized protein n=1 Tax=Enterobacter agglomerans TaxID=549 RepID=A0AAN2K6K6_ENTAG|nr:hypothetical protein DAPPPG734_18470 [Pantoea agglomerans]
MEIKPATVAGKQLKQALAADELNIGITTERYPTDFTGPSGMDEESATLFTGCQLPECRNVLSTDGAIIAFGLNQPVLACYPDLTVYAVITAVFDIALNAKSLTVQCRQQHFLKHIWTDFPQPDDPGGVITQLRQLF